MAVITSDINPRTADFIENVEHMQSLVDDLQTTVEQIKQGGVGAKMAEQNISCKIHFCCD